MYRPLTLFIGFRYTRAKRRNHFISFISLMSMLGIALGMIVLITVLSVMNGFDREIKKRVFGMIPAVTVTSDVNVISNWPSVAKQIQQLPEVTAIAPVVSGEVLLSAGGRVQPALVSGISPSAEDAIIHLSEKMIEGTLTPLTPKSFGIILGEELAQQLNVQIGDKITVMTPHVSVSVAGVIPRFKRFTLVGIFRAGGGFGFDMSLAFIDLQDAQTLFQLGTGVSALQINLQDVYQAPSVSDQLSVLLGPNARLSDWTDQFEAFFHAVKLEKTMMFFTLLLIIVVAIFNLVTTLVMVVNEKESDIAILRTLGATPQAIMMIFIIQGAIIGIIGTVLGILGGVTLAWHVTSVVNGIEHLFHVQFLSASVYFVDYLPSELQWKDVITISVVSLTLSLCATLYPAWRASKTDPVEALRYE